MDVTAAFLNGTIEKEVYMNQLKGFIEDSKEQLVCRLKHSFVGVKTSAKKLELCIGEFERHGISAVK